AVAATGVDEEARPHLRARAGLVEGDGHAVIVEGRPLGGRRLKHLGAAAPRVFEQDRIELGALDLVAVVRYRAALHEVERVLVVGFLIVEGRAVFDQGPRLPERVVNAEPIEQQHVGGQQRFPDVEAWKRLALDDEYGKVLLREQRRGRGATRPSADDENVTRPPGHCSSRGPADTARPSKGASTAPSEPPPESHCAG